MKSVIVIEGAATVITRKQIDDSAGQPDYVQNNHLRGVLFELLKERDSALEGKKAAELRASAYREVAANHSHRAFGREEKLGMIDAAAARIMLEKGGV